MEEQAIIIEKLDNTIEKLDKVIELLGEMVKQGNRAEESSKRAQQEKEPRKKYLVEDYSSPLEPVPWYIHSPQYNRFTCCADTPSELISKPGEETPHELKIK